MEQKKLRALARWVREKKVKSLHIKQIEIRVLTVREKKSNKLQTLLAIAARNMKMLQYL